MLAPSEILVLVPTAMERNRLLMHPAVVAVQEQWVPVRLCGFGPIAAGLVTARLLASGQYRAVLIAGIAGGLRGDISTGEAIEFTHARADGVGVGSGADFQSAAELGWEEFPGPTLSPMGHVPIGWFRNPGEAGDGIVSVCAASATADEAAWRADRFPDAVAEDMESFSVAVACRLWGIPCHVIRGIANQAGDRNQRNWKTRQALDAAASLLARRIRQLLESGLPGASPGPPGDC